MTPMKEGVAPPAAYLPEGWGMKCSLSPLKATEVKMRHALSSLPSVRFVRSIGESAVDIGTWREREGERRRNRKEGYNYVYSIET